MTPTPFDHAVVAFLVLTVPLLGALSFRRLKVSLAAGIPDVRMRQYRSTITMQILTAAMVTAVWTWARPLAGLVTRPAPAGWLVAAGWAATLAACAALVLQVVLVRGDPTQLAEVRRQLASVEDFLPHTRREVRLFYGLSLTAGICEEVVYRGFLMAYLAAFGGDLLAVPGSAALFGLVHAYQGPRGVVRTGAVGLAMALAYGATGTLLAPALLHAVIDVTSGRVAYLALSEEDGAGAVGAEAAGSRDAP